MFTLWLGAWLWFSGIYSQTVNTIEDGFISVSANAGLRVENILVEGRQNIQSSEILERIDVMRGDALLSVDPDDVLTRLEDISWIKSANVQIRYPDTVYIKLTEREPLAIWHKGADLSVVDKQGVVLTEESLANFGHLPVVTGEKANANAYKLLMLLEAEPLIYRRLKAAAFVGGRRWDLKLDNGLIIHLPENDIGLSLRRLVREQDRKKLFDKDIISVDARYEDRLIIKTKPGAVQSIRTKMPKQEKTNI